MYKLHDKSDHVLHEDANSAFLHAEAKRKADLEEAQKESPHSKKSPQENQAARKDKAETEARQAQEEGLKGA